MKSRILSIAAGWGRQSDVFVPRFALGILVATLVGSDHIRAAEADEASEPKKTVSLAWSAVFRETVELPDLATQVGKVLWNVDGLSTREAPRYECHQPAKGDFALYLVADVENLMGPYEPRLSRFYLLLEFVTDLASDWRTRFEGRTFGKIRDKVGLMKTGLLNDDLTRLRRLDHGRGQWETGFLPSYDGKTLPILGLHYLRDYALFAADPEVDVRSASWRELDNDKELGTLHHLRIQYVIPQGIYGGSDRLVVSDRVPIRGLIYAENWYSSSGGGGELEKITLINHGRLSIEQLGALRNVLPNSVIPAEATLLEQLLKTRRPAEAKSAK